MNNMTDLVNTIDTTALREQLLDMEPFPYFYIDDFLNEDFAQEVHDAFPSYGKAIEIGRTFNAVNEAKKVQITDSSLFPEPISKLNKILASKEFIKKLEHIMNIPNLIPDPNLAGGGIHETREGGRLDVHVDFNFNKELSLYRRVNILIYFNKDWKKEYGGILDLWDSEVKDCHAEIIPVFNRMACFATSEISYHGVTPIKCPDGMVRKSFAAYYYTVESSKDCDGTHHSTIFKARPSEWMRSNLNMPLEKAKNKFSSYMQSLKRFINKIIN